MYKSPLFLPIYLADRLCLISFPVVPPEHRGRAAPLPGVGPVHRGSGSPVLCTHDPNSPHCEAHSLPGCSRRGQRVCNSADQVSQGFVPDSWKMCQTQASEAHTLFYMKMYFLQSIILYILEVDKPMCKKIDKFATSVSNFSSMLQS